MDQAQSKVCVFGRHLILRWLRAWHALYACPLPPIFLPPAFLSAETLIHQQAPPHRQQKKAIFQDYTLLLYELLVLQTQGRRGVRSKSETKRSIAFQRQRKRESRGAKSKMQSLDRHNPVVDIIFQACDARQYKWHTFSQKVPCLN